MVAGTACDTLMCARKREGAVSRMVKQERFPAQRLVASRAVCPSVDSELSGMVLSVARVASRGGPFVLCDFCTADISGFVACTAFCLCMFARQLERRLRVVEGFRRPVFGCVACTAAAPLHVTRKLAGMSVLVAGFAHDAGKPKALPFIRASGMTFLAWCRQVSAGEGKSRSAVCHEGKARWHKPLWCVAFVTVPIVLRDEFSPVIVRVAGRALPEW